MGNKLSYPEEDLTGKVAIVTGGNTGIGYETAKALARLGAHTFIGCRSKERAEAAIERIKTELSAAEKKEVAGTEQPKGEEAGKPVEGKEDGGKVEEGEKKEAAEGKENAEEGAAATSGDVKDEADGKKQEGDEKESKPPAPEKEFKIEYLPLDLSSFQSTLDFVRAFKEKNLPLHILINNAAIAWIPFRLTSDGYEEQFQVNHLGPLLLTLELLPVLLGTGGDVRVVFVSSGAHKLASPFSAEKLVVKDEANYDRVKTYPDTKLYNVLTGCALQRRLKDVGITVSSLEPGYVKTELSRGWQDKGLLAFLNKIGYATIARTPVEGAATTINCAVNPKLNSQKHAYYASCKALPPHQQARVVNNQELLWEKSIEILKPHLSPDIVDKYGEAHVERPPPPAAVEEPQTTPPASGDKPSEQEATPSAETKSEEPSTEKTEDKKSEDAPADKPDDSPAQEPSTEAKEPTAEKTEES